MKFYITLAIAFFSVNSAFSQNEEIIKTFQIYKNGIINGDGDKSADVITQNSIQYYDQILQHCFHSDSTKLSQLKIIDFMRVMMLKHTVEKETLLNFNGKKLFSYTITEGMNDKNSTAQLELGQITINDNKAFATIIVMGQVAPMNFAFKLEEGNWKVDITSLFDFTEQMLQQVMTSSGKSKAELIFPVLEMYNNKKVSAEIWTPLK